MGWWLEEAVASIRSPSERIDRGRFRRDRRGYTGMWTAWHLLQAEPSSSIALLEGGLCGHGPSGRNGGFCESMWLAAHAIRERFGAGPALALLDLASRSVTEIGEWCEGPASTPGSASRATSASPRRPRTTMWAAPPCAPRPSSAARGGPGAQRGAGARCDSPVFRRGVFVPDFATVQPARLALGLRAKLLERGVRIFEGSRVSELGGDRGGVVARTAGGSVRAGAAVLGMGPRSRAIDGFASRLTVTSSHIVMTEPVPDLLEQMGWTGGECITDGRLLLHYFRTTPDGRIVLGWGGGRLACGARVNGRVEVDRDVAAQVARDLEWMFPGVRGRRLTHAWGGPIDVSPPTSRRSGASRTPRCTTPSASPATASALTARGPRARRARARPPRRVHAPPDRRLGRRCLGPARAARLAGRRGGALGDPPGRSSQGARRAPRPVQRRCRRRAAGARNASRALTVIHSARAGWRVDGDRSPAVRNDLPGSRANP